ncbi:unnamed protein product [Arctia plantaginis]|uniref:Uncharacterized protein n=1 Tax=Arctia plantaginis TaxID=874455 RepID=A0A8S1ABI7_ARCPL|nr:unnamed protein product [Arctia plantaginis]
MEVADQWRRQWAGTAEYGKVTEGGVTRRVARAMEVLHASGPGARVRVMRAAYHSSAGPGAPAESFMLHSSRRVISSGFNFLESPSLPTKPLEISSTPLEITPDSNGETENYKVTEPDDLEISEPSKWRGSTRGSSIRMPSEESSSTDNASIIDLDSRNRNLHRKYSYDSESSEIQFRSRSNSRNSQLLDAPTTLSTLKYKSLLNNSNEWNMRRKSYSFEDTSPINETILHNNATLAMESSTDSGICKSTEIVNDDNSHIKHFDNDERKTEDKEESFRDWLTKNRQNSQYKGTKFKTYRDHDIVIEDPKENNIALQSSGKLSITLPITIEGDHDSNSRKFQTSEDIDKRVKKVEFCKTEVHFAAESGKVNIIATDNKPPPSSDFRKRRSAFVPLQDMMDRPITLFGEKPNVIPNGVSTSLNQSNSDYSESDENTAATKSILKNKIPKPKPYLLGENMDFGISSEVANKNTSKAMLSAVSLVNQQMESEKQYKGEIKSVFCKEAERNVINNIFRTTDTGPTRNDSLKREKHIVTNIKIEKARDDTTKDIKNKLIDLKGSPTQVKPKTRQLRESDLTYFGIDNDRKVQENRIKPIFNSESKFVSDNIVENIFHSVKLIQQVSNSVSSSVCNSEPESDDGHEYQNIPLNINHAPVPTPRLRSKYEDNPNEIAVVKGGLKPIIEKEDDEVRDNVKPSTRRTKVRRQEECKTNRSLSEPPRNYKRNSHERSSRREGLKSSCTKDKLKEDNSMELPIAYSKILNKDIPIYANLNMNTVKSSPPPIQKHNKTSVTQRTSPIKNKNENNTVQSITYKSQHRSDSGTDSSSRIKRSMHKDTVSSSLKKEEKALRSERNRKSQYNDTLKKLKDDLGNTKNVKGRENNYKSEENNKSERYSRILQNTTPDKSRESNHGQIMHRDSSSHRKRNTFEDKKEHENIKPSLKLDSDATERYSSQMKSNEREEEFGLKHHHRSNKHREYVINYDDKKGTVSSICKIQTGLGIPRRKKTSKEMLKENHKDDALKTKTVDKLALLQLEDHQRDPKELKYADRKWKTKVHIRRSCQVL